MTLNIQRRIEALEALPVPREMPSPEASHRRLVNDAAACGLTEDDVTKLGGWGHFVVGRLTGSIRKLGPEPEREAADAAWDARVAKQRGDVQAAILEALREPWPPRAGR